MGSAADLDGIERALEQLLRLSASRKVHARRAAAAGVVVSQPGLSLLRRLSDGGPQALGELARQTDMDAAAAGRQIRQLEDDGLVVRGSSPSDGRVTVVRLTRRGADVHRRLGQVASRHMEDVLGTWSREDRVALGQLLGRLVDDLRAVHYRGAVEEQAS